MQHKKVWCSSCGRYHYRGSKAYAQCFTHGIKTYAAETHKPTYEMATAGSAVATITHNNAPAEDSEGNTYEFTTSGLHSSINLFDSVITDSNFVVTKYDIDITTSDIHSSTVGGFLDIANSTINGGTWKNSTAHNVTSTGKVNSSRCTLDNIQVSNNPASDNGITFFEVDAHNLTITGNPLMIRSSFIHHDGDDNVVIAHNSAGALVISDSVVNTTAHDTPLNISTTGNSDITLRGSTIVNGVALYASGGSHIDIDNAKLTNCNLLATNNLTITNSVLATPQPTTFAAHKGDLTITNALITQPQHFIEWNDRGIPLGWIYRSMPRDGVRKGHTSTITFATLDGKTVTVDNFDLLLYSSSTPTAEGTFDAAITRACYTLHLDNIVNSVTEAEEYYYRGQTHQ